MTREWTRNRIVPTVMTRSQLSPLVASHHTGNPRNVTMFRVVLIDK